MISYTKRNVQAIALLVTIVIFLILDVQFTNLTRSYYSKKFYGNNIEENQCVLKVNHKVKKK